MLILTFTPLGYLKVFGLTSFIQCFGMSAFGAALLNISPILTFLVCMVPRILMGYLAGVIFRALYHSGRTKILSFAVSSLSGAVLNTIFFVSLVMLLFGSSDYITEMRGGLGLLSFLAAFVGFNGLVEAIVAFVLGTAISKALVQFLPKE